VHGAWPRADGGAVRAGAWDAPLVITEAMDSRRPSGPDAIDARREASMDRVPPGPRAPERCRNPARFCACRGPRGTRQVGACARLARAYRTAEARAAPKAGAAPDWCSTKTLAGSGASGPRGTVARGLDSGAPLACSTAAPSEVKAARTADARSASEVLKSRWAPLDCSFFSIRSRLPVQVCGVSAIATRHTAVCSARPPALLPVHGAK
jgi:hypothetical protein